MARASAVPFRPPRPDRDRKGRASPATARCWTHVRMRLACTDPKLNQSRTRPHERRLEFSRRKDPLTTPSGPPLDPLWIRHTRRTAHRLHICTFTTPQGPASAAAAAAGARAQPPAWRGGQKGGQMGAEGGLEWGPERVRGAAVEGHTCTPASTCVAVFSLQHSLLS
eukprot:1180036-Prorocentrum_minimum.AAC.1